LGRGLAKLVYTVESVTGLLNIDLMGGSQRGWKKRNWLVEKLQIIDRCQIDRTEIVQVARTEIVQVARTEIVQVARTIIVQVARTIIVQPLKVRAGDVTR
jgi:hypothetical protein